MVVTSKSEMLNFVNGKTDRKDAGTNLRLYTSSNKHLKSGKTVASSLANRNQAVEYIKHPDLDQVTGKERTERVLAKLRQLAPIPGEEVDDQASADEIIRIWRDELKEMNVDERTKRAFRLQQLKANGSSNRLNDSCPNKASQEIFDAIIDGSFCIIDSEDDDLKRAEAKMVGKLKSVAETETSFRRNQKPYMRLIDNTQEKVKQCRCHIIEPELAELKKENAILKSSLQQLKSVRNATNPLDRRGSLVGEPSVKFGRRRSSSELYAESNERGAIEPILFVPGYPDAHATTYYQSKISLLETDLAAAHINSQRLEQLLEMSMGACAEGLQQVEDDLKLALPAIRHLLPQSVMTARPENEIEAVPRDSERPVGGIWPRTETRGSQTEPLDPQAEAAERRQAMLTGRPLTARAAAAEPVETMCRVEAMPSLPPPSFVHGVSGFAMPGTGADALVTEVSGSQSVIIPKEQARAALEPVGGLVTEAAAEPVQAARGRAGSIVLAQRVLNPGKSSDYLDVGKGPVIPAVNSNTSESGKERKEQIQRLLHRIDELTRERDLLAQQIRSKQVLATDSHGCNTVGSNKTASQIMENAAQFEAELCLQLSSVISEIRGTSEEVVSILSVAKEFSNAKNGVNFINSIVAASEILSDEVSLASQSKTVLAPAELLMNSYSKKSGLAAGDIASNVSVHSETRRIQKEILTAEIQSPSPRNFSGDALLIAEGLTSEKKTAKAETPGRETFLEYSESKHNSNAAHEVKMSEAPIVPLNLVHSGRGRTRIEIVTAEHQSPRPQNLPRDEIFGAVRRTSEQNLAKTGMPASSLQKNFAGSSESKCNTNAVEESVWINSSCEKALLYVKKADQKTVEVQYCDVSIQTVNQFEIIEENEMLSSNKLLIHGDLHFSKPGKNRPMMVTLGNVFVDAEQQTEFDTLQLSPRHHQPESHEASNQTDFEEIGPRSDANFPEIRSQDYIKRLSPGAFHCKNDILPENKIYACSLSNQPGVESIPNDEDARCESKNPSSPPVLKSNKESGQLTTTSADHPREVAETPKITNQDSLNQDSKKFIEKPGCATRLSKSWPEYEHPWNEIAVLIPEDEIFESIQSIDREISKIVCSVEVISEMDNLANIKLPSVWTSLQNLVKKRAALMEENVRRAALTIAAEDSSVHQKSFSNAEQAAAEDHFDVLKNSQKDSDVLKDYEKDKSDITNLPSQSKFEAQGILGKKSSSKLNLMMLPDDELNKRGVSMLMKTPSIKPHHASASARSQSDPRKNRLNSLLSVPKSILEATPGNSAGPAYVVLGEAANNLNEQLSKALNEALSELKKEQEKVKMLSEKRKEIERQAYVKASAVLNSKMQFLNYQGTLMDKCTQVLRPTNLSALDTSSFDLGPEVQFPHASKFPARNSKSKRGQVHETLPFKDVHERKNENQSEKRKETPAKDSFVPWSPEIPNVHRKSKESFVHCNSEQDHKLPSIDKHTTSIINSSENHDKKDRLTHSLVIHSHCESTEAGGFQSRFLTNKQSMSSHISASDLYAIDENSSSWLENL